MASLPNYTDLLPNNVLCMLFDRLDIKNVKNASLVCKRWNDIIFRSAYIDRFCIYFGMVGSPSDPPSISCDVNTQLRKAQHLAHTDRRYRHFNFQLMMGMGKKIFPAAFKAIELNQMSNLQSLNLLFYLSQLNDLLPLVIDKIPSMPQLRWLSVSDQSTVRMMTYEHIKQENIPSIQSKSLQELTMYCKYRYTIDTPELQTFAGALCALLPPDGGDKEQLVLTKLKKLDVTVCSWKPADRNVFRRMPNLAKIYWGIPLEDDLFVAMCKTCPHLTEAYFSKEPNVSNRSAIKYLDKLSELRILKFSSIEIQNLVIDLSKLSHLEELALGHTHLLPISLLSFPKTIRKLGLHIYGRVELSLVEITVRNLPQLTELYLNGHTVPISSSALKALRGLEHLEVLLFSHFRFTRSKFLEMNAPMPQLRTLRFHRCKLETKQLMGLRDKFPKLQNTEFEECDIDDEPDNDQPEPDNDQPKTDIDQNQLGFLAALAQLATEYNAAVINSIK